MDTRTQFFFKKKFFLTLNAPGQLSREFGRTNTIIHHLSHIDQVSTRPIGHTSHFVRAWDKNLRLYGEDLSNIRIFLEHKCAKPSKMVLDETVL